MGCYPIRKILSFALGGCNGKKRREARMAATSPLHIIHCDKEHMVRFNRATSRSVTFNETPIIITPPAEPKHHHPEPEALPSPSSHAHQGSVISEHEEPKPQSHVRHTEVEPNASAGTSQAPPYFGGPEHKYITSPLPVWDERERRRDYFSRECHYYPTPLREGIYSIATDANRLTTIFSEENPNACSIS